jgi:hypothetical protein
VRYQIAITAASQPGSLERTFESEEQFYLASGIGLMVAPNRFIQYCGVETAMVLVLVGAIYSIFGGSDPRAGIFLRWTNGRFSPVEYSFIGC